ncbi:MAG: MmgE/PrpD family protein [Betaproteobacteria bacterium]|nr:MmgE/PrpD family protein [Betaproteobacteria bacterium]
MAAATVTEAFIDRLLAIDYRSLPREAVEMSKQVALDGLGVALAGWTEPLGVGRISAAYVREMGGAPQASVLAGGFKTSMQNAAYANGCMAHALDFENLAVPPNHPTSPTLPAILAIAEHHRLPGEKVVEAIVAAFEVQGRVRLAASNLKEGGGFHKPGTVGLFGAVAAAARLLGLDRGQSLMAFGIAGSRACTLSINNGTMTKSSHAGHAARMGVECGVLAKMGWTASADVFGPKGFFDTFWPGGSKPELLTQGFGEPLWIVDPGVGFKAFPCNGFTHRSVDAAIRLREEHGIQPAQIDCVEIVFPRFDYVNRPQPRSGLDGKFSLQYTTLVALLDGEATIESFTNERLAAPDVAALLPKVRLRMDDSIPLDRLKMHVVVNVWLKDGRRLSKRVDKLLGAAGNSLTRDQRLKKFFGCTRRVLGERAAGRMLDLVERLERLPDVTALMDIARGDAAAE